MRSWLLILSLFCSAAWAQPSAPPATKDGRPAAGLGNYGAVMGGLSLLPPSSPIVLYTGAMAAQKNSTEINQQRLNIILPVYKNEKNQIAAILSGGLLNIGDHLTLSKTNTKVPKQFYRSEIGTHFSHEISEARHFGIRGNFGYSSDKPFQGTKDLSFNLNGSYSYPGTDNSFWVLTVFVSNNSPLGNYIPIPGFIYFYKTETFTGMFGLPIASLQWKPIDPWAFSFSLFGPNINVETAYSLKSRQQIFVGANWSQQSFMRHERQREDDRLILEEKRAFVGFKSPLSRILMADIQAGQSVDRVIYEGDGFLNRDQGSVDIKDSWFAQLNVRCFF